MEELFSTGMFRVTRETGSFPDGRTVEKVRVHRPDTTRILAFPDDDTIIAIKEYRPFYGVYLWMLPGGKAKEETLLETAAVQLREEAGYEAGEIEHWHTGLGVENVPIASHYFTAKDLTHVGQEVQEDECISVEVLPFDEAFERIVYSETVHQASAYGMLRYEREHRF